MNSLIDLFCHSLFLCFCIPPPPPPLRNKIQSDFDSFKSFFVFMLSSFLFLFLLSSFFSLCVDSVLVSLFLFFVLLRVVQCMLALVGVPRLKNVLSVGILLLVPLMV